MSQRVEIKIGPSGRVGVMERRSFIQLLAGGLILPMELFRGRSQVAVGGIWAPVTLATIAKHRTDTFLIGRETWVPFEVEELGNGKFLHKVRRLETGKPWTVADMNALGEVEVSGQVDRRVPDTLSRWKL